ncbi:MAG: diguanylate cyclase [Rhodospirillaceae bacterium]|nr:diguanylate cyclase [Rhodospirillaceae bacterium]|tara:strand:- start:3720 stop:5453 length:1734 start_codon:yes stop_codon:yes gene_type:complete
MSEIDKPQNYRKLQEEHERFVLAMAAANDGLWDWDLRTDKIFFSARWKEMLGLQKDEITDAPSEWLERIHADDIDRLNTMLEAHLNNDTPSFEVEYRVRHFNESYRWMLVRGLAVRATDGVAYRIAGSQTDITEKKTAEQKSIYDALHDTLTGLANRTLFLDRIRQVLKRRQRTPTIQFAVIYLDLDRFRLVNESLGHVHGDELIILTGQRLKQSVPIGDTVARLGGDEYSILMEDIANIDDATQMAETIQKTLSAPFSLGGKEVFSTGSMGIAFCDNDYQRPEEILRDSELAMYRAKRLGKAQSIIFDDSFRKSPVSPIDLDTDLRRALDRDEMMVHYQPIISLRDGTISGFEALLRWHHRIRGNISPSEFIPLAEETGLIYELGQWVLHQACLQTLNWNKARTESPQLELSINLSGRQFTDPKLVQGVVDNLQKSGLKAENLKLEITESVLMENAHRSIEMLNQLKDLNIKVCVDDFGTGYSSLSYLHTFPIDTLKVDRSFVNDMGRNYRNMEIIRTITMLAHNLKLDVIAEGVETAEQHAQLSALGCQYAQGFYFSRPIDSDNATNLIQLGQRW